MFFFFFKQKTAYEMRISDWSSDVCSSDLRSGSRNTWGDSVNLDEDAVRSYIVDNALMWMRDYHVDGLRLDAVHALHDERPTHILREIAEDVRDRKSTRLNSSH